MHSKEITLFGLIWGRLNGGSWVGWFSFSYVCFSYREVCYPLLPGWLRSLNRWFLCTAVQGCWPVLVCTFIFLLRSIFIPIAVNGLLRFWKVSSTGNEGCFKVLVSLIRREWGRCFPGLEVGKTICFVFCVRFCAEMIDWGRWCCQWGCDCEWVWRWFCWWPFGWRYRGFLWEQDRNCAWLGGQLTW